VYDKRNTHPLFVIRIDIEARLRKLSTRGSSVCLCIERVSNDRQIHEKSLNDCESRAKGLLGADIK